MNKSTRSIILSLALATPAIAAKPVTFESLLEDMADRSLLTHMPDTPFKAKMASSYDRQSKVNNPEDGKYVEKNGRDWGKGWFANHDFKQYIREEDNQGRKEYVLMEDDGPGVLIRWWCVAYTKQIIRIYLDGSDEPVIAMPGTDLIGGKGLVGEPFSFKASDEKTNPNWRGHNLYLPIPYAKSCKVTYGGVPEYYHINYNSYQKGTKVESFSMDQIKKHQALIDRIGKTLTNGNRTISGKVVKQKPNTLAPGESVTLDLSQPGAIGKLSIQISADDYQQALRSTVVQMNFDGKETLWMPVGTLGGVGYSAEKNETYYITVDPEAGEITSYYLMPYQKKASITLTNHGDQKVRVGKLEATHQPYQWKRDSLYFHGTWFELRNISTQDRSDLNYVTVKGKGQYVGTSITIFNTDPIPSRTWWGEGDEKIYVDGESFPSIFGTGTEDYFGYAFCRPQRYNLPFISQPRGEGNKKAGYTNNNRYHFLDVVPFNQSVQFDMEIWHPFRKNMNYAAATFFYADKAATHNIDKSIESVQHKVALTREDVLKVGLLFEGKIEAETLSPSATSEGVNAGPQVPAPSFNPGQVLSAGSHLFAETQKPGDFVSLSLPVKNKKNRHQIKVRFSKSYDFGLFDIKVNGKVIKKNVDLYSKEFSSELVDLGKVAPKNGEFEISFILTKKNPRARGAASYLGVDQVVLDPVK